MEKTEVIVAQLLWDDWNLNHIARHNVAPEDVAGSLNDKAALFLRAKQGRVMVLGRTGTRLITTILNEQEAGGVFYVITARDMSKKERAFYRRQQESSHG